MSPPRILVVHPEGRGASSKDSGGSRFESLAEALRVGGCAASCGIVRSLADFSDKVRQFEADMVFSSFFSFPPTPSGSRYLRDAAMQMGVAWVGSSSETLELALSKPRMKKRMRAYGIDTPDWFTVERLADGSIDGIGFIDTANGYPYIVKPSGEGNSRGIDASSIARSPIELLDRATAVADRYGEALVERYVAGDPGSREFTVAMIGNGAKAIVSPIEIRKTDPSAAIVTEDDKEGQAASLLPIADPKLRDRLRDLATRVFLSAGARDYARCDILLHHDRFYAIELNGQPMVPDRWFAACASESGLDDVQYINAIAYAAISRNAMSGYAYIAMPREMEELLPRSIAKRLSA
jgi:D-alanine-D-alanine ligase